MTRRPAREGKAARAGRGSEKRAAPLARSPADVAPTVEVNGWRLYTWPAFRERWDALVSVVEALRQRDAEGYRHHPQTRFLALLRKIVMEDVPRDPGDARYRQGKSMGGEYMHWRRARFGGRFRLFFRYHTSAKVIVYAWLNDESTLRKEGSRSDAYATFRAMLEQGRPPSDWDDLLRACSAWRDPGADG